MGSVAAGEKTVRVASGARFDLVVCSRRRGRHARPGGFSCYNFKHSHRLAGSGSDTINSAWAFTLFSADISCVHGHGLRCAGSDASIRASSVAPPSWWHASHGSRFGPALPATCMEVPALPHLPSTELSVGISSQLGMQTGSRESPAFRSFFKSSIHLLTARRRIASSTTGLRPPWRAPPRAPPVKARWLHRQRRWGLPSVGLSCFVTMIMCRTLLDPSRTCW